MINDSFDLINELKIENATKEQVVWLSENPSVVRLNGSIAKALSEGETKITAKVKNTNVQASMKIRVQEQILHFKQKELSLVTNKTFNLNYLLEIKNIEQNQLKWTVENPNILTINKGQITTSREGRSKVIMDNPIIKVDREGYIKTFFGQTGVTNVTLRSRQNPHVSITMRVEVVSFINDVLVSSHIFDEIIIDGTHTGELQYQLFSPRREGISIQDFVLYDGYNRVIFRDSKTYALEQIYSIKLNKVYKPYAEFTLMYKDIAIRCRKEVNVVTGIPIPKAPPSGN